MQIYEGIDLKAYEKDTLKMQHEWKRRTFSTVVENYFAGKTEKILAVCGLRGTGKTVGMLQAAEGFDAASLLMGYPAPRK